jgi:hypothetical protein
MCDGRCQPEFACCRTHIRKTGKARDLETLKEKLRKRERGSAFQHQGLHKSDSTGCYKYCSLKVKTFFFMTVEFVVIN